MFLLKVFHKFVFVSVNGEKSLDKMCVSSCWNNNTHLSFEINIVLFRWDIKINRIKLQMIQWRFEPIILLSRLYPNWSLISWYWTFC
jgi:hypothetical protein